MADTAGDASLMTHLDDVALLKSEHAQLREVANVMVSARRPAIPPRPAVSTRRRPRPRPVLMARREPDALGHRCSPSLGLGGDATICTGRGVRSANEEAMLIAAASEAIVGAQQDVLAAEAKVKLVITLPTTTEVCR
jgi:hypothetical protein